MASLHYYSASFHQINLGYTWKFSPWLHCNFPGELNIYALHTVNTVYWTNITAINLRKTESCEFTFKLQCACKETLHFLKYCLLITFFKYIYFFIYYFLWNEWMQENLLMVRLKWVLLLLIRLSATDPRVIKFKSTVFSKPCSGTCSLAFGIVVPSVVVYTLTVLYHTWCISSERFCHHHCPHWIHSQTLMIFLFFLCCDFYTFFFYIQAFGVNTCLHARSQKKCILWKMKQKSIENQPILEKYDKTPKINQQTEQINKHHNIHNNNNKIDTRKEKMPCYFKFIIFKCCPISEESFRMPKNLCNFKYTEFDF